MALQIISSGRQLGSVISSTLVDFILDNKIPFSHKKYEEIKQETNSLVVVPLKIIALLVIIFGLLAMVFEIRNFPALSLDIYFIRLGAVLVSLTVLSIITANPRLNNPGLLVHVLLLTIITSSGMMIKLLPQSLLVNSSIVGLMIFTASLFLSWEVKNQIIVAIYYNFVFAAAILLSDRAIYFLPNMIESVAFVLFLSMVSIIACAINFRTRVALAERNFEVEMSELKFRSIIDNSAEGIFQSTAEGKWLTINRAFANILGYKNVEELLDTDVNEVYADADAREKLMADLKKFRQVRDYRIRLKKKNNEIAVVRLNDRIVTDELGREFFEGNIYDITDQVKAEEYRLKVETELKLEKEKSERLADDAVNLTSMKSRFLANMSHEIRTPMNGILGFLTLIEAGSYEDEAELKSFSSSARQSAESLLEIINSVLDLSKIEAGKIKLEKSIFDFRNVINQSIDVVATRASEKKIQIVKDIPDNVDTLLVGDQTKIRQIFINLLGNAVKFTAHGEIKVSVRSEKINNDEVKIFASVIDSGRGIPAAKINSLFKPFSQIDGSEGKEISGTGLGLVICKEYINLMGGEISVSSKEGKGSRFNFNIILRKQISEELERSIVESLVADEEEHHSVFNYPPVETNQPPRERNSFNILLAEDNMINQKVSLKILTIAGYNAVAVNNGMEAVEEVKKNDYDLILMDIQMPEVDGFTATNMIRVLGDNKKDIPIVALTAHALMGDREKCLKAGMNDYISKPIIAQDLINKIDELLKIKSKKSEPANGKTIVDNAVFDFNRLKKVSMDDANFERDLLTSYLEDVEQKFEKLNELTLSSDIKKVIELAHTIKGASYSVGAKKVGDEAYAIEISGKSNDIASVEQRLGRLRVAISETKLTLEKYLVNI